MKRRIIAWLLTLVLIVGVGADSFKELQAAETDISSENNQISTEAADAASAEEDVAIDSLDVEYKTVEWKQYDSNASAMQRSTNVTDETHDIVLVLDISGSMTTDAMRELKKACNNFIDDILAEDENAGISIVTYESAATAHTFYGEYFTNDKATLKTVVNSLSAGGNTAMNAGLLMADQILLQYSNADKKYIIQMADGCANTGTAYRETDGKYYGTEFIDVNGNTYTYTDTSAKAYASEVYNSFYSISGLYHIFSLGFFHGLSGVQKQFTGTFLNDIQNTGYYEVVDADLLSFSFENIAQSINSEYLKLNKSSLVISKGESETLTLNFSEDYPSDDRSIKWGSSDTNIAKINSNGRVTGVEQGTCTIVAEAGGYKVTCPVTVGLPSKKQGSMTLVVLENKNGPEKDASYVLSNGATVTYDGVTFETSLMGTVTIPKVESGEISVSKTGYSTRTITAEQLEESTRIHLQQESENPVINAVWIDNDNVLENGHSIDLTSSQTTTISVDIDWGKYKASKVQLVQGATKVDFTNNTLSMVLKNKFDVTGEIYVVATNDQGNTTKKLIQFEVGEQIEGLNGLDFSIGNDISLTLPEKFPWIGGKKVGLDMATGTLPITATVDNGKVYITLGVDVAKYTKSDKYATSTATGNRAHVLKTENKLLFDNIKSVKEGLEDAKKDLKKLKNLKQTYKTAMKYPQGSFGFKADFTVFGYMEGYIDSEYKFVPLDGGVILAPSVGVDWSGQFAIGPIPCYWEAEIAAEVQAQLNLYRNKTDAPFLPAGKLEGTVKGSAGVGIGVNKVATIGGGATLKFVPSATFYDNGNSNYFSLTTSINLYFKVKVACFEHKYEPDPIKSWKIDNSKTKSVTLATYNSAVEAVYATEDYTVEDLGYLDDEGIYMQKVVTRASSGKYANAEVVFHDNSYTQTEPQIVSLEDNTRLAVWVDSSDSDINRIQIHYSYYDGAEWSDPAVIDNDGTPDFSPDVCVMNKKAYVIWQDAGEAFDSDAQLDDVAGKMGITAAEFHPASQTFTVTSLVENSGYLNTLPTICGYQNKVVAAWVENKSNQWFGATTDNSICISTWDGTTWTEMTRAYENINAVSSLAVDYFNENTYLVYSVDGDNSLETTEDMELYVNGTKITDNTCIDSAPQFSNHKLYWYSDGTILYADDMTAPVGQTILDESVILLSDDYQIVEEGLNRAIIYSVSDDVCSELYGVFYDDVTDSWGIPVQLTDEGGSISGSAIWNGDALELLCNKTIVNGTLESETLTTDELFGTTALLFMKYEVPSSLVINDCYYDSAKILPGGGLPINIDLKNAGIYSVEGVMVEVIDSEGTVVDKVEIATPLLSGEENTYQFTYLVKETDLGKTYTIRCTPLDVKNADTSEATAAVEFVYHNLKLENLTWGHNTDNTAQIIATVRNDGYHDVAARTVSLIKNTSDGEVVQTVTVGPIGSMEAQTVTFDVDFEDDVIYYVKVDVDEQEVDTADNSDFVHLQKETEKTTRTLISISAEKTVSNYKEGDSLVLGDIVVRASFDDGTSANISKVSSYNISGVNMSTSGKYPIVITYEGKTVTLYVTVEKAASVEEDKDDNVQEDVVPAPIVPTPVVTDGYITEIKNAEYKVISAVNQTIAFQRPKNKNITKITIPPTVNLEGETYKVTSIANNAFKGFKKLTTVTVGKNIVTIGSNAFNGCSKLKTVKGAAAVTTIGNYAFKNCTKLTTIPVLKKIKTINVGAFMNCKSLKKVVVTSKQWKTVKKNAFKGVYAKITFKVPSAKLKAYKKMLQKKTTGYKKTWIIKK